MDCLPFVRCVGIGTGIYQNETQKAYDWRMICVLEGEGARGCMRECYIHLEKKGVLTHKFHNEFRKRKPWKIDRSRRPENVVDDVEESDKTLF